MGQEQELESSAAAANEAADSAPAAATADGVTSAARAKAPADNGEQANGKPPSDAAGKGDAAAAEAKPADGSETQRKSEQASSHDRGSLVGGVVALVRSRRVESWSGSLVVHAIVLVVLAFVFLPLKPKPQLPELTSVLRRPDEVITQVLDESLEAGTAFSAVSVGSVESSGEPLDTVSEPELDTEATDRIQAPQIDLEAGLASLPTNELDSALGMDSPGEAAAVVEGYGGAMDRLTQEILLMLDKGKVLVVWLFDQSLSVKDDQQEVKDRIGRVYEELGLRGADNEDAMLTAVASFGQESTVHTDRPTADQEKITAAIEEIPVDETGEEQTFRAVIEMIEAFRRYGVQGKRQLAMIIVSDESGDDGEGLEVAIDTARRSNCRIYCLGREAVFGYPYAHMRWVDEETGLDFWLRIRRGPESPLVEQLQTEGFWRRYDAHPSGFGPYEQARLCRETGGIFFMLPSIETNLVRGEKRIYELEAMRPYLPDLRSRAEYEADQRKSALRRTMFEVIGTLDPYRDSSLQLLQDYPVTPAEFRAAAEREAQKAAALIRAYAAAEETLTSLARERRYEPSPRWQANYDILLAQTIVYRVRCNEYVAYLDAFMRNPKAQQDPKTTHWRVRNRAETIAERLPVTDEATADLVSRSQEMLRTIIAEHAGTPFAARAQWELNRGYGMEMHEWFRDPRRDTIEVPSY